MFLTSRVLQTHRPAQVCIEILGICTNGVCLSVLSPPPLLYPASHQQDGPSIWTWACSRFLPVQGISSGICVWIKLKRALNTNNFACKSSSKSHWKSKYWSPGWKWMKKTLSFLFLNTSGICSRSSICHSITRWSASVYQTSIFQLPIFCWLNICTRATLLKTLNVIHEVRQHFGSTASWTPWNIAAHCPSRLAAPLLRHWWLNRRLLGPQMMHVNHGGVMLRETEANNHLFWPLCISICLIVPFPLIFLFALHFLILLKMSFPDQCLLTKLVCNLLICEQLWTLIY